MAVTSISHILLALLMTVNLIGAAPGEPSTPREPSALLYSTPRESVSWEDFAHAVSRMRVIDGVITVDLSNVGRVESPRGNAPAVLYSGESLQRLVFRNGTFSQMLLSQGEYVFENCKILYTSTAVQDADTAIQLYMHEDAVRPLRITLDADTTIRYTADNRQTYYDYRAAIGLYESYIYTPIDISIINHGRIESDINGISLSVYNEVPAVDVTTPSCVRIENHGEITAVGDCAYIYTATEGSDQILSIQNTGILTSTYDEPLEIWGYNESIAGNVYIDIDNSGEIAALSTDEITLASVMAVADTKIGRSHIRIKNTGVIRHPDQAFMLECASPAANGIGSIDVVSTGHIASGDIAFFLESTPNVRINLAAHPLEDDVPTRISWEVEFQDKLPAPVLAAQLAEVTGRFPLANLPEDTAVTMKSYYYDSDFRTHTLDERTLTRE